MYKLKNISEENLLTLGFRRQYNSTYCLHFPIYWWNRYPVIYCNAYIDTDIGKRISIEVVREDGSLHKQWLEKNYVQAGDLLNQFDKEIHKKMNKIGAKYYEDR